MLTLLLWLLGLAGPPAPTDYPEPPAPPPYVRAIPISVCEVGRG